MTTLKKNERFSHTFETVHHRDLFAAWLLSDPEKLEERLAKLTVYSELDGKPRDGELHVVMAVATYVKYGPGDPVTKKAMLYLVMSDLIVTSTLGAMLAQSWRLDISGAQVAYCFAEAAPGATEKIKEEGLDPDISSLTDDVDGLDLTDYLIPSMLMDGSGPV